MATLILSDGTRFAGTMFGHKANCSGEVVFTTGMAGYQELITDPACRGQIVCMTYPLIGNVGVNDLDFESGCAQCAGLVVGELCEMPSNWQMKGSLSDYLEAQGVVGLYGVDTRALTRKLRTGGTMTGRIVEDGLTDAPEKGTTYTCEAPYALEAKDGDVTLAVLDLGTARSVLTALTERGASLRVYPAATPAQEILDAGCDGVVITAGPGKPEDYAALEDTVRALMAQKKTLGIGMGHLLMASAQGGTTRPLLYGHHGSNLPVKDMERGVCTVTAQHIGHAVDTLPAGATASHVNSNDQTVEGLAYADGSRSVSFIPDAGRGLYKKVDLYDAFLDAVRAGE